ncbi:MAG TPA: hypothetical protein VFF73_01880, partial [Planctomycetota bacterium]|nr:hypothetical protein [Planctomycetota bacterium]
MTETAGSPPHPTSPPLREGEGRALRILAASALGTFLVLLAPRWVAGAVPGGAHAALAVTMACLLGLALSAPRVALVGDIRRALVGAAGGVLLWMLVAATEAPPAAGFAIAGALALAARPIVAVPFVAGAIALGAAGPRAHWTPYHAVGDGVVDGEPLVEAPAALGRLFPRRSVLVLGAAPREVAAVVSAGASRVLVAELDPELARRVRGPGVEVVVGDPRALLERT